MAREGPERLGESRETPKLAGGRGKRGEEALICTGEETLQPSPDSQPGRGEPPAVRPLPEPRPRLLGGGYPVKRSSRSSCSLRCTSRVLRLWEAETLRPALPSSALRQTECRP